MARIVTAALAGLLFATGSGMSADSQAARRPPNRLARESSPYLRQHAHNPVDWRPWGPEAFADAKKENKLIFLSIGYSSCHWCHVMERESFSDDGIAKLLNESFVCIKVDREERPDVDQVYMTALSVCGIDGGWPLSMFLTPDGKPIIGGTYWPPRAKVVNGREILGFDSVLQRIIELDRTKREELRGQGDKVADLTRRALSQKRGPTDPPLGRGIVEIAVESLIAGFDPAHGGFGNPGRAFRGPKFPSTPSLELLWRVGARRADLRKPVQKTLEAMARGGIFDQIGGGFHRYSTERTWTVPHFEKMLYDNAQLTELYARAFAATGDPLYRRIVEETLEFVRRDLTAPSGGFYSALDADADGEEGKTYVWTLEELMAALPDAADVERARRIFGCQGEANFEKRAFVLTRPTVDATPPEQVAALRDRLRAARDRRPQPFRDTKIIAGWNGQMIAGYAEAGRCLNDPRFTQAAVAGADAVLTRLRRPDGRLARCLVDQIDQPAKPQGLAFLDDYAYLIHGMLSLHDATQSSRWLTEAIALAERAVAEFADADAGGFFLASLDHDQLFVRCKDQYDGAQPSGNSMMVNNLLRLSGKTGDRKWRDLAGRTLKAFAPAMDQNPTSLPMMAAALDAFLDSEPGENAVAHAPQVPAAPDAPKKSDAVVKVSAVADKPNPDGQQQIRITVAIDKGWHVYANPIGNPDLESSQTSVTISSKGKAVSAQITYPKGKLVKDAVVGDYNVYETEAVITAIVPRRPDDREPLEVAVKLQACNEKRCLLPSVVKIAVP